MRLLLSLMLFLSASAAFSQDWSALNAAGLQSYRDGKYTEAIESFLAALDVSKKAEGEVSEHYIHSLNNLAFVYKASGNYAAAQTAFQKTIILLDQRYAHIHVDQIEALTNLGNLFLETGQYDSTELYFHRALQKMSNAVSTRDPHYLEAIDQFELVLVNLQNGMASMHRRRGQLTQAIEILTQEREHLKKRFVDSAALQKPYRTILSNLSTYHIENNDPAAAKVLIDEYIRLSGSSEDETLDHLYALKNLGDVYRQLEQADSALLRWNEALKIIDSGAFQKSELHLAILNNIGELYAAMEAYTPAIENLENARSLNESRGGINPRMYQTTLFNLAEAYHFSGNYLQTDTVYAVLMDQMLKEVLHNFTYLSESEKISFYRSQLSIVESYTFFALSISGAVPLQQTEQPYIRKTVTQRLYDLQIMTKGLILNSSQKMKSRILNGDDEKLKANYLNWEARKNQLANLLSGENPQVKQVQELEEIIDFQEKQLSRASAGFKKGFVVENTSWREVQQKLKPGEAAVEMIRFVGGLLYGALILTPETNTQPVLAIIESRKTRHLEKEYYRQYANAINFRLADTVSYAVYWKPVMDSIQAYLPKGQRLKRIYFSPDGIYNQINLNTLYDLQKKQFVLDQVEIHQVVNTKQLVQGEGLRTPGGTAALFGRPAFASPEFVDLPGTEKEIDQIDQYLRQHKYKSRVYKQAEATEENLKDVDSPYILHLATHGFFENNAESSASLVRILLNSGIALSGVQQDKERDDGILTAYEALNLNLDANELTVLSACETGLGEFYPGEGVYGLRLALTSAGARYVMMSLWKVDDRSTQELMILFYKHWLKSHDNIRLSFQRAQQELRKKYPEPYYWGAFVLTGR